MRTCRSWRFHRVPGHDGHDVPGACRKCWTPCFQQIPKDEWAEGARRCADCERALLQCPMVPVRRALVDDELVTHSVLVALTSDPSGPVAATAQKALAELERENRRRTGEREVVEIALPRRSR